MNTNYYWCGFSFGRELKEEKVRRADMGVALLLLDRFVFIKYLE